MTRFVDALGRERSLRRCGFALAGFALAGFALVGFVLISAVCGCTKTLHPIRCDGPSPHPLCTPSSRDSGTGSSLDGSSLDGASPEDLDGGAGPTCTLAPSGPITVTRDGEVIEGLHIVANGEAAVRVEGFSNVVIRDSLIEHEGAPGISVYGAPDLSIENVSVVHTGAPIAGPNPDGDATNIDIEGSPRLTIRRVQVRAGADGIALLSSPDSHLSGVEAHALRGPEPSGQCVRIDQSDGVIVEDFSCENPPAISWPQHGVLVHRSSGVVVRRGLLDGNNSPAGVGVIFEMPSGEQGGLVEDVDAIRQGNGCFAAVPAFDLVFRRTRCKDIICADQGRGSPESGGLAWAGYDGSSGLRVELSTYENLCADTLWDETSFEAIELTEAPFEPRAPIRLSFCWE